MQKREASENIFFIEQNGEDSSSNFNNSFPENHLGSSKLGDPNLEKEIHKIFSKHHVGVLDLRKNGLVEMQNEAIHYIKQYCKKNHISEQTASQAIIMVKTICRRLSVNMGRNVAKAVLQQDVKQGQKNFIRGLVDMFDNLGWITNDIASQMVAEKNKRKNNL